MVQGVPDSTWKARTLALKAVRARIRDPMESVACMFAVFFEWGFLVFLVERIGGKSESGLFCVRVGSLLP